MAIQRYHPLGAGCVVTSGYGPRNGGTHYGIDYGWPGGSAGKPVYAVQSGTVVAALYDSAKGGFGWYLDVDSDDAQGSNVWVYGHIVPEVKVGDKVKAGQRIATVNGDRKTNGGLDPHVHVEVHKYVRQPAGPGRMNPAPFLEDALYVSASAPKPAAPAAPTPGPSKGSSVPAYTMNEIDFTGQHNSHSQRWGSKPWGFVLHTEEGNGTARSLHSYFSRAQVSYHYTVDNKELIASVDTDRASWSVMDANPYTINLCFAGSKAGQSREVWLSKFGNAIDLAAQVAVRDCKKYGIALRVLRQDYKAIGRRTPGMFDHSGITYGLGIGDHTDVGKNFPWDVFEQRVNFWSGATPAPAPAPAPAPKPVVNAINEEAKVAAGWLGKRLDADEKPCKDGEGRYVGFENGKVYWHPRVGAWAIPTSIFEAYGDRLWEQSFLGYPIGRHTVLTDPATGNAVGDVQGFEGGAIYRKHGQPGYVVCGAIRQAWNNAGFENGTYGWPTSDEEKRADGTFIQTFERGNIVYATTGIIGLRPLDGPDEIITLPH